MATPPKTYTDGVCIYLYINDDIYTHASLSIYRYLCIHMCVFINGEALRYVLKLSRHHQTCIKKQPQNTVLGHPYWSLLGQDLTSWGVLGGPWEHPWALPSPGSPKTIKKTLFGNPFGSLKTMKFLVVSGVCFNMYFQPVFA